MKLIIVLLTTVFIQFSVAADAQKVTLSANNSSLEKIFKEIRIQTGYDFFCDLDLLKNAKKIDIHLKDVSLETALISCLKDQELTYVIDHKIIVITKKKLKDIYLTGKVVDESGQPLPGATVTIKRTGKSVITSTTGAYSISAGETDILIVSYIGYNSKEVKVSDSKPGISFIVTLSLNPNKLQQVEIVSTGYQDLPKERATGSFEVISKEQLQHSTSGNLLRRLEGIATSMDFSNNQFPTLTLGQPRRPALSGLTIRGKNTLTRGLVQDPFSLSGNVLIVIDGIATPYSIDDINPNDVESINILKDAAASSIWGSRASNGVIVIKTKKGMFNSPTSVSFSSNLSITDKLDLFYKKRMSISEYIDAQVLLYNKMYEDNGEVPVEDPNLIQPQQRMSPVAEIMNDLKMGRIDQTEADAKLNALRGNDIRRDYEKYLLRKPITQNYTLGISGGSKNFAYRLSGGYDYSLGGAVTDGSNRATLNYTTTIQPLKNLEIQTVVAYNQQNTHTQPSEYIVRAQLTANGYYPYSRLADDQGNPLSLYPDFRPAFLDSLAKNYGDKILDMSYKPLEEIKLGYNKLKSQGLNLNLNANYKINNLLSASLTYSYNWGLSEATVLNDVRSYYMRQLINTYTTPAAPADGNPEDPLNGFTPFQRQVPLGGRYTYEPTKSNNQTLRAQVNLNKTWDSKHVLSAIAGADVSQNYSISRSNQYFGYQENGSRVYSEIPYGVYVYTLYNDKDFGFSSNMIPSPIQGITDLKSRMYSFFSNAAYTFDRRYTLSGSIRKDASSLFGNAFNTGGTPYFSVGSSWNINNESFYKLSWLPYLQLKATFGYNGNTNARFSSIPTITFSQGTINGLPFANTNEGTNPQLRPEKSATLNLGIYFGLKNNRLSGSFEYYVRKTTDLVTSTLVDPSTGFPSLAYNVGNLRSAGVDLSLSSLNLQAGLFSWTSNFLFSYNRVKITKDFNAKTPTANDVINQTVFIAGQNLSSLYAWKWAGLDPQTGDPMGFVDGKAVSVTNSQAYTAISQAPVSSAKFFGSSVPVYFGSFRNTFRYQNFAVSANFMYKLGYYFRPPATEFALYNRLFPLNELLGAEYANRWQKPGDENITHVPSIDYTGNGSRDSFYYLSEVNVLKADHIRLQEINLSYTFNTKSRFIKNPRIYAYANNLGIIWRANKAGFDPDVLDYPQPRSYSFGFSANF
ncbi:SusC/RagA family TonB-linked outer membrane protein [Pedobacter sp. KBW06]|uniref:SusC/RagA family TonB-linked outer membrane protein n=1 Tax=Pedobacter sp. KBW06 TaxID=2153359 RepID=UPI001F2E6CEB|nr:SusC/RagA family TonB-linked outer membrane protein [Pedobacter sp. KBW06]